MCLELGKHHLNGVHIQAVWRQKQEPVAPCFLGLEPPRDFGEVQDYRGSQQCVAPEQVQGVCVRRFQMPTDLLRAGECMHSPRGIAP